MLIFISWLFLSCDKEPELVFQKAYVFTIDVHDTTQYTANHMIALQGIVVYQNDGSGPLTFKIRYDEDGYTIYGKTRFDIKAISSDDGNALLYQPANHLFQHTVDGSKEMMYRIDY